MKKIYRIATYILISIICIQSIPLNTYAATFAPPTCPAQTDMATYLTDQVDSRVQGLTANDATKKIFTTQNFANQVYVRNPTVWTVNGSSSVNLTGISTWNSSGGNTKAGTLITPRHLAFATHYAYGNGTVVAFVANDNSVATRTVVSTANVPGTDITIGVLNADVPNSITYYPIIDSVTFANRLSVQIIPMLVLDQEEKALIRDAYIISGSSTQISHNTPFSQYARSAFSEELISGDSGNPAFVIFNDRPVLMLTHTGSVNGPNYGNYISQINTVLTSLGGGYQVSTFDVSCFNQRPVISPASFLVNEGAAVNTTIGTLSVQDDVGNTRTYSITSGNNDNIFSIDSAGRIKVASSTALNYHSKSVYVLQVTATDNAPIPLTSAAQNITIGVQDLYDSPLILTSSLSVNENQIGEYQIGTLSYFSEATTSPTFSLISGNDAFRIESATGKVYLRSGYNLNYEDTQSYILTARIMDSIGSSTALVTVNVNDVNEPPVISNTTLSIADAAPKGSSVGIVAETDPDPRDTHVYTLIGGNVSNAFSINAYTGEITVNNPDAISRSARPSFSLLVKVQDSGSPIYSDTKMITVDIGAKSPANGGGGGGGGGIQSPAPAPTLRLQQQNTNLPASSSPTFISPVRFTSNLQINSKGEQVRMLQKYLNDSGFVVASTGIGSKGNETTTFGPATKAALIKFQKAKGITPASGYFGPLTRKYILEH